MCRPGNEAMQSLSAKEVARSYVYDRGVDDTLCGSEGIQWNLSKGNTIGTMLRVHSRSPYLRGIACSTSYQWYDQTSLFEGV